MNAFLKILMLEKGGQGSDGDELSVWIKGVPKDYDHKKCAVLLGGTGLL